MFALDIAPAHEPLHGSLYRSGERYLCNFGIESFPGILKRYVGTIEQARDQAAYLLRREFAREYLLPAINKPELDVPIFSGFGVEPIWLITVGHDLAGSSRLARKEGEPLTEEYSPEETVRRMERGIRRFLDTPPKPHGKNPSTLPQKPKRRPASKGRVHKAKSRS